MQPAFGVMFLGENTVEVFTEYLSHMDYPQHRARMEEVQASYGGCTGKDGDRPFFDEIVQAG